MNYPILIVNGIKCVPCLSDDNSIVYYNIGHYRVVVNFSLDSPSAELIVMDECFAVEVFEVGNKTEEIVKFLEENLC